ncbi:MAG: hypothetical protein AAF502_02415 [Bacteroidota bacterium]
MKFEFGAQLIKKRARGTRTILTGFFSTILFGYSMIQFFNGGFTPVDWVIDQLGLDPFTNVVYAVWFGLLLLLMIPALFYLFRKKAIKGGTIYFDEKTLYLTDGRQKYEIPQSDLDELVFELKQLPDEQKVKKGQLYGGSYMIIPMGKKEYKYELQLENERQKEQLLNMVEFLKIQHDVKVKVNEAKK